MFYHAIHARRRDTGSFEVVLHGFSQESGHPPQEIITAWQAMRTEPRIGEAYTNLQRFLDNVIVERFQLAHPDEGAKQMEALRAAEADRAAAEKKASVLEVQRAMTARGLTVEDIAAAADEKPPVAVPVEEPPAKSSAPDPPEESETAAPPAADHRTSRLKKHP
jgi:hypothetical protein